MGIQTSLDELRQTTHIVDAMRVADELAFVASRNGGARTVRVLAATLDGDDQLTAIASTHALAQVFEDEADDVLAKLLSSDRGYLREHAAWAFSARLPRFTTIARLIGLVVEGGFSGMLAQRTLQSWASSAPDQIAIGLESALIGVTESRARRRIVESLGVSRGRIATAALIRIARNESESDVVRVAAVAGLGDRAGDTSSIDIVTRLAAGDDFVAEAARLALVDLTAAEVVRAPWQTGLTVAQLFLHADIDPQLTRAGSGDNGGIATLLVRLGDALAASGGADAAADDSAIQRVITLSRGSATDALDSLSSVGSTVRGHAYASVPLLSEPVASSDAWQLRVAAERGIRRVLRAAGSVDVLHLRMADVGSLAAANVARDLGIPVVFTVAPDPHAVIRTLDMAGDLTRANFGETDEKEHFWFRARLVQRLAGDAAHTVLFPRPNLEADMRELVGIDITAHPERHSIVPEGIDLAVVDRAVEEAAEHAAGAPATPALASLRTLLSQLPEERRDLPLLISVGRFHRIKGMATVAAAWANGPLRERANLLLVGGDLENPSADELEQLDRIDRTVSRSTAASEGLLMPGHRPNDEVARWVAAARFGVPGLASPGGVYVCGSLKEEFGIAILEAMAAGLLVVAPAGGGPATYVEEGVTGFLTRTSDPALLAASMSDALDAMSLEALEPATTDARPHKSRDTVARTFTIQAMARALGVVYTGVSSPEQHADSVAAR
ncbi:glycosyltransferase involved in cell wall biosynthesis [Conyzicola lurida]|uniref:D-inositol 3-phosphate glycosyltransferase n=1 Tax=Conyzicola lurida TaxID=1172621 RepID=A0A841ASG1_9MICO|nr:glycosyltransferase involved in cell wall biosynthesis [Conyzicola lurida]